MEKTIAEQLAEIKAGLETFSKAEIKAAIDKVELEIKAIETKADKTELKSLSDTLETLKTWQEAKDTADKSNQKVIDAFVHNKGKNYAGKQETKSFNDIIGEAIEKNADKIRGFRPQSEPVVMDLMPEVKAENGKEREVKAVGDMTIATNFPGAGALYQDVRGLIANPYEMTYIADLLPSGSSTGTQLAYPKEGVPDGGVAPWTDYTANKAQVDFNLSTTFQPFAWLAGWVTLQRDMLDDISWMTSFVQSRLLLSLKLSENTFVLNGIAGTSNVGLQQVASPYNGSLSNPVDKAIDAAYGQIPDGTFEWYNGNLIIVRKRDLVTKFMINKAIGSGEYDLPAGAVAIQPNGMVSIGNLKVVGTTAIPYDTFYALDTNATMFVRRIAPELRLFEDATLAKKNQVMFRIEERAALAIFNNAAIVKGVLTNS